MLVDVYLNLHKSTATNRVYSIRSREKGSYGKVIGYESEITLKDCKFVVSHRGREKVRAAKAKLVHAVIRGTLVKHTPLTMQSYIGYCPYQSIGPNFYAIDQKKMSASEKSVPVKSAEWVLCLADCVEASGIL